MVPQDIDEMLSLHHLLFPVKYSQNTMQSFLKNHYLSIVLTTQESEVKEKIIGVSVVRRRWVSFFSSERQGYLCTFGIDPEYQHSHLGTDILHVTCQILKNHFSCNVLSLHMQKINKIAFKFYIKFGFHAIAELYDHYSLPGEEAVAILMDYDNNKSNGIDLKNKISFDPKIIELLTAVPPLTWMYSFFTDP